MDAPAKLNLTLHITGRRADGYHLLESLVVFTQLADHLEIEESAGLTCQMLGPFALSIADQDNLVLRAAEALRRQFGVTRGARILVDKQIPPGGGLGGGSSNAAATLLALNQLWQIDAPLEMLMPIAASLGADVPVCLLRQPALMRGVGEEVLPLPDFSLPQSILLVNPGIEVETAGVYQAFRRTFAEGGHFDLPLPVAHHQALVNTQNALTDAAITICPVIRQVLDVIANQPGCELARLCGSGATCFGLFGEEDEAEAAGMQILSHFPDWWVCVTKCDEVSRAGRSAIVSALDDRD